ncbi:MAG: hypothetical protein JWQ27_670 [Ferruginibacter sp.]|nr:hypothetical protein [Ferruginibacter sp.]
MKNLFFVSVILSIFTGTSLTAHAQIITNSAASDGSFRQTSVRFIEGIEMGPAENSVALARTMPVKAVPVAKPAISQETHTVSTIERSFPVQFKFAQLLNRNVESITNLSLFNFINDWWRTKYRFGGTGRNGIDCSALVGLLFNSVYTIHLPRTAREQYAASARIAREDMAEGDMVFFNTKGGVSHVGVYLGDGYFVHASVSNGVTISSLDESYYSSRFIGGGRIISAPTDVAKTDVL